MSDTTGQERDEEDRALGGSQIRTDKAEKRGRQGAGGRLGTQDGADKGSVPNARVLGGDRHWAEGQLDSPLISVLFLLNFALTFQVELFSGIP